MEKRGMIALFSLHIQDDSSRTNITQVSQAYNRAAAKSIRGYRS